MFSIKVGVDACGIKPELVPVLIVANEVYANMGYDFVITSLVDGQHRAGSLHAFGFAADMRTKHIPIEKQAPIRDEIAIRLGPQYDVILEADHIHVEFDPR